jgi:hypothetical protein
VQPGLDEETAEMRHADVIFSNGVSVAFEVASSKDVLQGLLGSGLKSPIDKDRNVVDDRVWSGI